MLFVDANLSIPMYMQIYEQFKNKIIREEISGGSKLPSIRNLSLTLGVSRNTVESAYMQLCAEGYIESKPGSGFVSLKLDSMDFLKPENNSLKSLEPKESKLSGVKDSATYKYNLSNRCLGIHEFPINIWKKLSNQCLSDITTDISSTYSTKWGDSRLQEEIMKYLKSSRGVKCRPEQIIISSGLEYSLSLLSQLFKLEYDMVAMEDPGYTAATDIFKNNGLDVVPISLEKDGINIKELDDSPSKIVYVTPSHQFPMGTVLPIKKRLQLLEWARRRNGIIIEDDYDSEFRYNSRPIPSLQSIDTKGCVIYIGTFSKSFSPSVRISYMVLPESILEKYDNLFNWYHISVSSFQQKILQQFMSLGYWERHLRKVLLSAIKKHDLFILAIRKYMGDKVIIHGEHSGLHILLEFKNGLQEEELVERAKNHGIQVLPVSICWIRKDHYSNNMIMIGYGGISIGEIEESIKTLAMALFD